jgi:hypothetical protein
MSEIQAVFRSIWCSVLGLLLLPVRLIYLLVQLLRHLPEMARESWEYGKNPTPGASEIADALDVDILPRSPDSEAAKDLVAQFAADFAEGRAFQLLDRIAEADRARELTSGRYLMAMRGVEGAMKRFNDAMVARNSTAIIAAREDLEELVKARPKDHIAACLLAQAYIDIGWSFRGGGYISEIPKENLRIFFQHFEKARMLLEPFDPMALNSPLLARTRYHLVPGIESAETKVSRWYYDWSTLAPKHWECHTSFAFHMLPQWFGSGFDSLDRAAHDACQRLSAEVGAAPYFFFMMTAEGCLQDVLERMDFPLFLKAVEDLCVISPVQSTFNMVAAALMDLSNKVYGQSDEAARRRSELRQVMTTLLRTRVRELHLDAWGGDRESLLAAVEIAFHDELKAGARIRSGVQGLEALMPKPAPAAPEVLPA